MSEQTQPPDAAAQLKGLSPERRAKLSLTIEQAATVKLKREILERKYVKAEDVERERRDQAEALRGELLALSDIADELEGLAADEIRKRLAADLNELADRFAPETEDIE